MTAAASVFITGTDTGIGKTRISCALLLALRQRGFSATGMKPVASGAQWQNGAWCNDDVEQLRACSSLPLAERELINPYALRAPIAPELAAREQHTKISLRRLRAAHRALAAHADWVVVEGVGGWEVVFTDEYMQADLVRSLKLPVILVVGIRLGCINHALLSARAIRGDDCRLLGWIANHIDPEMAATNAVVANLAERLPVPLLAELPFGCEPSEMAPRLAATMAAMAAAVSVQ